MRMKKLFFIPLGIFFIFVVASILISSADADVAPAFVSKWGPDGDVAGKLNSPRAITVDSEGNVYVADSGDLSIKKFDKDGIFLTKWGSYRYTYAPGTFGGLCGLEADSLNNIYVADCSNARQHVQKFSSNGEFLAVIGGSRGTEEGQFFGGGQNDVAVDSKDNVYVLDAAGQTGYYGVHVFSSNGTFIKRWGPFGSAPLRETYQDNELRSPFGIAIDSQDSVYITDGNREVKKFTKDGVFITKWGIDKNGWYLFRNPSGIDVDDDNNVYVVDYSSHDIQVFSSNGVFLFKWGSLGSGDGQFNTPYGTAIYGDYVYVVDGVNHRIQKFARTSSCTEDTFSCSDWGVCSVSGSQARTCKKTYDCSIGNSTSPATSQSCTYVPPSCTSWTYSSWSACSESGQQARTVLSSSPSGCAGGSPVTAQSCTYTPPACTSSSWSCDDWSACSADGAKTRVCKKNTNCEGGAPSPATSQWCRYIPPVPACTANDWSCVDWGACTSNNTQKRTCSKIANCQGGTQSPATTQSCVYTPPVPACTANDWLCGSWSDCSSNSRQTRACEKTSNCEGGVSSPVTTKFCTYTPPCTEDTWQCDVWSSCSPQGVQGRSCRRILDCPTIETKVPDTSQYCQSSYQQPASLPDDDIDQDFIIRSTVKLACYLKDGRTLSGVGSGTIIDPNGIILTNNHVVKGTIGCWVGFQDSLDDIKPDYREIADISKISTNPNLDIALLKIRKNNTSRFSWINITKGINYKFKNRERIYIYGYPVYLKEEKMKGISHKDLEDTLLYSNMSPTDGIYSGNYENIFIKTSAKIEHGNSGGGAYTQSGSFIGIPTAAMSGDLESLGLILTSQKINQWLNNSKIVVSNLGATISPILARVDMKNTRIVYINTSDAKVLIYFDKTKKQLLPNRPEVVQASVQPTFQIANVNNKDIAGYYVYFGSNLNTDPVKSGKFITKNEFVPTKIIKDGAYYFIFKAENKDGVISDSFITEYIYKATKVIKKKK